ncbi:MAG TPA: nitroreductase family protein [Actinomycetota bacterium]|nr:nitroreductase family protein [Actinomycetota bacterium]
MDLASTDHLLTTTRTVRKRLDLERPVDRELILDCLRVAVQAPTGSNLQSWRWVVVTDEDLRAQVAGVYQRAIGPYNAFWDRSIDPSNKSLRKVVDSSIYLEGIMARVPVLVIPCALGTTAQSEEFFAGLGYGGESLRNMVASGFYGSIWPAVWSFMLAARSRGLGSALTTMHLALEREMGELLGIPDTVTQVGLIPVAYFTGDDFKPAKRRPPEEITYWDGWKKKTST